MNKRELLGERSLLPNGVIFRNILYILLAIILLILGTRILADNLKYINHGVDVEAKVVNIIDDETMRAIYITYEYDGVLYENKDLKYWSEELDIDSIVIIRVLKNHPEEFSGKTRSTVTSYFMYAVSAILLIISLVSFINQNSEKNRVYKLLTSGEKCEGVVVSCEQMGSKTIGGKYVWCITASIGNKTFDSCKNYTDYNLNGTRGYLVDIYIDKENEGNFYIDFLSFRRDKNNKLIGVDRYEQ